jgi:uncharacterized membrane protein
VDRLRTWGRNPWLVVGIVIGALLVCAWLAWGIHVWSDHGARQGVGALLAWAVIAAIVAAIVAFILAIYFLLSPRESGEERTGTEPSPPEVAEAADLTVEEKTEAKTEAKAGDSDDTESEPEAEAATS